MLVCPIRIAQRTRARRGDNRGRRRTSGTPIVIVEIADIRIPPGNDAEFAGRP
jgi:hypothetical protein